MFTHGHLMSSLVLSMYSTTISPEMNPLDRIDTLIFRADEVDEVDFVTRTMNYVTN